VHKDAVVYRLGVFLLFQTIERGNIGSAGGRWKQWSDRKLACKVGSATHSFNPVMP
jgi:hypothetical protein